MHLPYRRHLLHDPPPLPDLFPGGAATTFTAPTSSSPLLIPLFIIFICLLFFLIGFLIRDIFSFLHSPSPITKLDGLNPTILNSFPVIPYREILRTGLFGDVEECSVCLSEFEMEDNLRVVMVCGHLFHKECVDFWLESKVTCPVCRADLRNEPDQRLVSQIFEVVSLE